MGTGNSTLGAMTLGSVVIARRSWEFFIREKKNTALALGGSTQTKL